MYKDLLLLSLRSRFASVAPIRLIAAFIGVELCPTRELICKNAIYLALGTSVTERKCYHLRQIFESTAYIKDGIEIVKSANSTNYATSGDTQCRIDLRSGTAMELSVYRSVSSIGVIKAVSNDTTCH